MQTILHIILILTTHLTLIACGSTQEQANKMITKDFEFTSGNQTLSGIIDLPVEQDAKAMILFVHGSGPTDIRQENRYIDLRSRFTAQGISCVLWDKPGNGRSEGSFDQNQPVEKSAQEILDALAYLRSHHIPGHQHVGLWGTSRGGWVAPIALSRDPEIAFWISVAGVPGEMQKYYLLESNLPLDGHSIGATRILMEEWIRGKKIFMNGGNYDSYLNATTHIRKDTSVAYFAGDLSMSRAEYNAEQAAFMEVKDQYNFDPETLSMMMVPGFEEMLSGLEIQVLALFGEKDRHVNWRKTKKLYESTIGKNPDASLTIYTFPHANHAMNKSETGAVREVEGRLMRAGEKADGYYQIQIDWLRQNVLEGKDKSQKY